MIDFAIDELKHCDGILMSHDIIHLLNKYLGIQEAKEGGRLLKEAGITFDKAYTSMLRRAIKTCWLCLEEVGQL